MTRSREFVCVLALTLLFVQCLCWGVQVNINTSEAKYVCPRAAAKANGATVVRNVQKVHGAFKDLSREVWGNG